MSIEEIYDDHEEEEEEEEEIEEEEEKMEEIEEIGEEEEERVEVKIEEEIYIEQSPVTGDGSIVTCDFAIKLEDATSESAVGPLPHTTVRPLLLQFIPASLTSNELSAVRTLDTVDQHLASSIPAVEPLPPAPPLLPPVPALRLMVETSSTWSPVLAARLLKDIFAVSKSRVLAAPRANIANIGDISTGDPLVPVVPTVHQMGKVSIMVPLSPIAPPRLSVDKSYVKSLNSAAPVLRVISNASTPLATVSNTRGSDVECSLEPLPGVPALRLLGVLKREHPGSLNIDTKVC